jgi:hypothetical protein
VLYWNGHRVMGVLAMSRAIGDHCLRPYVIPEPEVGGQGWNRAGGAGRGQAGLTVRLLCSCCLRSSRRPG